MDSHAVPQSREEQLQNMTNTVWQLESLHREQALPLAERIDLLRTHYEIQRMKEEDLQIPERDRTFLYLQEQPTAAALLVPGGHSTPAQYFHLGRHLYRSGMAVYGVLLSNEATVGEQRGGVPWQHTIAELEMHYERLALLDVPIHLVGSSFGGILVTLLALRRPARTVTLLSPPFKPHLSLQARLALGLRLLLPWLFERMVARSPHRWLADRFNAMREARGRLGDLKAPLLAIHAKDNEELPAEGLKAIRKARGERGDRILLLDEGGHMLLQGPAARQVQKEILDFIQAGQPGKVARD
jgi:alpha-beta hydrolase superfamily lysophospholipase